MAVWRVFLLRCLLVIWVSMPISLAAQEQDSWVINLENVGFGVFIQRISEITNETYVVDPNINTNVTVVSSQPLNEDAINELFLSVLKANGLSLARTGDIMLISQKPGASQSTIIGRNKKTNEKGVVTKLVVLEHIKAQPLLDTVSSMISEIGNIQPAYYVNGLIMTDYAGNIERITDLISQLDTRSDLGQEVVPLEYVWVGNIITVLQQAFLDEIRENNANAASLKVVADEHNNAVFISGTKSARARVKRAIQLFDKKARQNMQTRVVYLSHTGAQDIVTILENIITNINEAQDGIILASVQAEPETNSIIIRANPTLTEELQDVIARLDVRRPQVHIEAAIVEVTDDLIEELGIQYGAGDAVTEGYDFGSSSFTNIGQSLISVMRTLNDQPVLGVGQVNGVSLGTGKQGDFSVLLQALAGTSNANLLSTPSITTLDNKEATITVGQNVPFRTGVFTNDSGGNDPFTTIERRDVGIQLRVLPRIHDGNVVRLEIEQEVSSVVEDNINTDAADIITNTRNINTTILADNEETIVLGGLIRDDITKSESKVPLLGDIPYLGRLFKSTRDSYVKQNLLVFLRPTILRGTSEAARVSDKKYDNFLDVNAQNAGKIRTGQIYAKEDYHSLYDGTYRAGEDTTHSAAIRDAFAPKRKSINSNANSRHVPSLSDETLLNPAYDPDRGKLRKIINHSLDQYQAQQSGRMPLPNDGAIRLQKLKPTSIPVTTVPATPPKTPRAPASQGVDIKNTVAPIQQQIEPLNAYIPELKPVTQQERAAMKSPTTGATVPLSRPNARQPQHQPQAAPAAPVAEPPLARKSIQNNAPNW